MSSPFKRLKEVYARTYSLDTGRDADFFDCVNDIYFSPEVQSLKKYPQHDKNGQTPAHNERCISDIPRLQTFQARLPQGGKSRDDARSFLL